MAEVEIKAEKDSMGRYARHPLRTAGTAFLAGALFGVSMMGARGSQQKSGLQKFIDQLGL